ncbi:bifunctional riboflavin kinase/FAD synthetase [Thermovenabulum gondwanense]|uniref:Riboflavin biosynthesis protein n=1 Tax=Thermovenabulum gondwanense TaxID=520767 RepID=A0A162MFZ6_9FIRM|nr:bifunctional riboflavin kinase/FAD synthetase [Thermovenabulum gondwanense]KYO65762.1 Riboflavin biosynthesis protein RibF [Thermovenabulum gondwanense]
MIMKTYLDIENFTTEKNTAVGLGNFDGVHLGHRRLITVLKEESRKRNLVSTILTFDPHPSKILFPEKDFSLIDTLNKKISIIKSMGISLLVIAPFTYELSRLNWEEFVEEILLEKMKAKLIVVGYNFTFGYNGQGNVEKLSCIGKEKGFETIVIPPVKKEGEIVSSSKIRLYIKEGDMEKAQMLLGRPFSIEGRVIKGKSLGRKLGFPTANIEIPEGIVLPSFGVYSVYIKINNDKIYEGIANIGINPTFMDGKIKNPILEVHIFDFTKLIYGEQVEVFFIKKIRDEKKFESPNALAEQIKNDITTAKEILRGASFSRISCIKG